MKVGASLFALFFLLVVNFFFFTEAFVADMLSIRGRPGRSVLIHEVRAKRIVGHHYPSRGGRSVPNHVVRAKRHKDWPRQIDQHVLCLNKTLELNDLQ
uniref:Uncharacterized protein n=1 Tax=Meloidogyne enterolobii TaxID=390850 RepID=A0A6V7V5N8_MELEN|nr:unnamed protein product [Meloidogyne enterolobii]